MTPEAEKPDISSLATRAYRMVRHLGYLEYDPLGFMKSFGQKVQAILPNAKVTENISPSTLSEHIDPLALLITPNKLEQTILTTAIKTRIAVNLMWNHPYWQHGRRVGKETLKANVEDGVRRLVYNIEDGQEFEGNKLAIKSYADSLGVDLPTAQGLLDRIINMGFRFGTAFDQPNMENSIANIARQLSTDISSERAKLQRI